jgi:hypothetical protein
MRWASLHITAAGEITVSFPRTKGGKVMRDTLTPGLGQALMHCLVNPKRYRISSILTTSPSSNMRIPL